MLSSMTLLSSLVPIRSWARGVAVVVVLSKAELSAGPALSNVTFNSCVVSMVDTAASATSSATEAAGCDKGVDVDGSAEEDALPSSC